MLRWRWCARSCTPFGPNATLLDAARRRGRERARVRGPGPLSAGAFGADSRRSARRSRRAGHLALLLREVTVVLARPRLRKYVSSDEAVRFVADLAAQTVLLVDPPGPYPAVCRDPATTISSRLPRPVELRRSSAGTSTCLPLIQLGSPSRSSRRGSSPTGWASHFPGEMPGTETAASGWARPSQVIHGFVWLRAGVSVSAGPDGEGVEAEARIAHPVQVLIPSSSSAWFA